VRNNIFMKVNWIIENLVKEKSFLELSEEAKKQGYNVQDIKGDFKHDDIKQYQNECVVFNGSIEMCKLVSNQLAGQFNYPITYSNFDNYLCSKYYGILGKYLFNDNFVMLPLSELKRRMYQFYGMFGKEASIFIRPDSGDKTFKGGILDLSDADGFFNEFELYMNDLVIISTPKNMVGEWRFICTKYKEILAVSSYIYQGLITRVPSAPIKATEFCSSILEEGYFPDSVFCVDIVQDTDGNFWLMELTSFSSAGLYAAKKENIIRRVSEIAWEDFNLSKQFFQTHI